MPKTAVGSMRQKILIEGDENLLEPYEMLIEDSDEFSMILKERMETGEIKTSVVVPIEDYIGNLESAYKEGKTTSKK